ncbi:MAG: hypothetical protein SAL07_18955 [Oscillatoria sp. PMC 1051.18]|nr:hypothetical protein [Oscillatoria sp. PMC 1050.18]MEC5031982.1 hypothetical protein [Oscillatoria sp. PMC 1051.18]
MTYIEQLYPWRIVRNFPNLQNQVVAKFRRRNDALAHLQVLQRLVPSATFAVIFDPSTESKSPSESK